MKIQSNYHLGLFKAQKSQKQNQQTPVTQPITPKQDSVSFTQNVKNSPVMFNKTGNAMSLSFTGKISSPLDKDAPALQFRVRGVSSHQKGSPGANQFAKDDNVTKLAESSWKDGDPLGYEMSIDKSGLPKIELYHEEFGTLGRVPDAIAGDLGDIINGNPNNYKFELSNVIAGTSKGAPTIGLRAVVKYTGDHPERKEKIREAFYEILNTDDKEIAETVMVYQPPMSPKEVLDKIISYEKSEYGQEAADKIERAIDAISKEITNPENKNILILGHVKPDGDTLGSIIAMKEALQSAYPDKMIDCSVDDKIPGLFRQKMPGIEDIKRPYDAEKIEKLERSIEFLSRLDDNTSKQQLEVLKKDLVDLKDPNNLFDPDSVDGTAKKEYDLVITMDIPTPKRFTGAYKEYIENSKKQIYIDHHPHRISEWQAAKDTTGLDMHKIHQNDLALIAKSVPAATQLVTIVADNAGLLSKMYQSDIEASTNFVASVVTGASTDTGSFTRTANLLPKHSKMPVQQRPNFYPEGMSTWMINELADASGDANFNKKWLREKITFDIPDSGRGLSRTSTDGELSPRDLMLTYALKRREMFPDIGLGIISANYDEMYDVFSKSLAQDPDVTLLDVQNGFKYSEALGALKSDPARNPESGGKRDAEGNFVNLSDQAKESYTGPYDDDRIGILIIQDRKEGNITENSDIARSNGIRLSLRSGATSNHAEILANLFSGGGHGGASGGRIDLPGVELDTPLAVNIDGVIENDMKTVHETLVSNNEIMRDNSIPAHKRAELCKNVKVVKAQEGTGRTVNNLIADVVTEIRKTQADTMENAEIQKAKDSKKSKKNPNSRGAQNYNRYQQGADHIQQHNGGKKAKKKKNKKNRI